MSEHETIATQETEPGKIESELRRIWEPLEKEKKTRACLFNLIIYTKLGNRCDYFRLVIQKIIENYPCRIIFITNDPDSSQDYLKTAVSVIAPTGDSHSACDLIDIGVAGKNYERISFIVIPHLLPDLPTYLLWSENPTDENELFQSIEKLSNRIIFDSQSAENIFSFAKDILKYHEKYQTNFSDLHWSRMEPWRDLISNQFCSVERLGLLYKANKITITYNSLESTHFTQNQIQALYITAWLASRLHWKRLKNENNTYFFQGEEEVRIELQEDKLEGAAPGMVTKVEIESGDHEFRFIRDLEKKESVTIETCTSGKCDASLKFNIGKEARGQSLSKDILRQGTSNHLLEMLKLLTEINDGEK